MIQRTAIMCFVFMVATCPGFGRPKVHPQTSTAAQETVWYWFGHCGKSRMIRIEVLLNGRQLYPSLFPICRMSRANVTADQTRRKLVFFLKGGHVFQGEYCTTPAQTIEANIWEAGGDPGDLLWGVSFMTKRQVLLNTIHIMKPDRLSVSTLDRGLVVKTNPVAGSRTTEHR